MISLSNIERFATKDGPGIRTTVFLKGCPLHCPWCANPETWSIQPVVMHKENLCVKCHTCEMVCPEKAVSFKSGSFHIDRTLCNTCGTCVNECLPGALSINGKQMSVQEILKEVLKDQDYYEESGGGVTFSGGEPLVQNDEIIGLLKAAKEAGLHVAVETTGVYDLEHLKQAEPYIDLFLFDVKHVNAEVLKEITGAPFDTVKENFEYLCTKRGRDVIARVPVIPGFNSSHLDEIIHFIKTYPVRAINLLPYHNLGKTKWHQLQKNYSFEDEAAMSAKALEAYADDLVSVGG